MRPSEQAQFGELISDALSFYRRDISKFALTVWWQACQPFDFEQVGKALTAHAMDADRGQFAPMPADIVKQLQGTQTDRSLIAWGKVLQAMQMVGAYASVVFDDGAIHASIEDMGGWPQLCRTLTDDLPHVQRRFTEAYRTYAKRPDLPYPPRLIGVHERENSLAGHRFEAPYLIGDADRAQEIQRLGQSGGRVPITPMQAIARSSVLKRIAP